MRERREREKQTGQRPGAMGNRQWAMGNRQWAMGYGRWAMGYGGMRETLNARKARKADRFHKVNSAPTGAF